MTRAVAAVLLSAVLLTACSHAAGGQPGPTQARPTRTSVPTATVVLAALPSADPSRSDNQGSVEFVVEPLNLMGPGETIDFLVSMNTHSVDLGWDLAAQSTLETDAGRKVDGLAWPIGNGHHYGGTLSFPRETSEGEDLLDGAKVLRLVIRDTDVAERVFIWGIDE